MTSLKLGLCLHELYNIFVYQPVLFSIFSDFKIIYEDLTYHFERIKDWLYRKISDPTLMTAWGPRRVPFTREKLWGGGDEYGNESSSQGSTFQWLKGLLYRM